MRREMLINVNTHETRAALMEEGELVEILVDRDEDDCHVGNLYKGRVTAVLPGMQAAFVDIGLEKSGFLHASDIGDFYEERDEDEESRPRRSTSRRSLPIQDQLKKGQEIIVQVAKEAMGTKGPRLTAQISLPGRLLVYMPNVSHIGVSRKIDDRGERSRLRRLVSQLKVQEGGVIVRTAGEELSRKMFDDELNRLSRQWQTIKSKAGAMESPALLFQEARLVSGLIRDVFSEDVQRMVIDSEEKYREIADYLKQVSPELVDRIELYDDPIPLFDAHGIEAEIEKAFRRKVELRNGGYIVIEPTEALVSIDVNTGSYTGSKDPEETVLRTNLDAAREIARQLRLRDVGGIIVCDFIDMEEKENQQKVVQELRMWLGRDRAKTKAFEVSGLGLIEMTRQRVRPSLYTSLSEVCPTCEGIGRVFSKETMAGRIERALRRLGAVGREERLQVRVHPSIALYVLEEEKEAIRRLEEVYGLQVEVRDDPLARIDQIEVRSLPSQKALSLHVAT